MVVCKCTFNLNVCIFNVCMAVYMCVCMSMCECIYLCMREGVYRSITLKIKCGKMP